MPSQGALKGARSALINVPKYPMDFISITPAADYGLRRQSITYTGNCLVLRRLSDNTTMSIPFLKNGNFDVGTSLGFCAGSSGYISTWYDESGNARDVVQATINLQPQLVNSGVLVTQNNRPSVNCANTTSGMSLLVSTSTTFGGVSQFSANVVSNVIVSSNYQGVLGMTYTGDTADYSSTNSIRVFSTRGTNQFQLTSYRSGPQAFVVNNDTLCTSTNIYNSTLNIIDINNSLFNNVSYAASPLGATCHINVCSGLINPNTSTGNWSGSVSEASVWGSALSNTDRSNLEHNQGSYYNFIGGVP